MSDYEKIARAIGYIRSNVQGQPRLSDVASHVHLSEYHFQRLFSRWAGVTPKRYLQLLTLERAKQLVREGRQSTLETSAELGLSSGSRLYDHFVSLDAVTPSEYQQAGRGLVIHYGYHDTPYGEAFIAVTPRGVCKIGFVDRMDRALHLQELKEEWVNAQFKQDSSKTGPMIDALFINKTQKPVPISLWVRGTNFQVNVWRALLGIQPGEVKTYRDVACAIGKPKAARSVGSAIGKNPVGLLIPCHRVIRQSGELGGYRWGEVRKHAMLARESAQYG